LLKCDLWLVERRQALARRPHEPSVSSSPSSPSSSRSSSAPGLLHGFPSAIGCFMVRSTRGLRIEDVSQGKRKCPCGLHATPCIIPYPAPKPRQLYYTCGSRTVGRHFIPPPRVCVCVSVHVRCVARNLFRPMLPLHCHDLDQGPSRQAAFGPERPTTIIIVPPTAPGGPQLLSSYRP
jgi:hypothetical protein